MTDIPYNFETTDWKEKPIISATWKYKSAHSRSPLKKSDFSGNLFSSFTFTKFMGQVQKRRLKIKVIILMCFVTYVARL